MVTIDFYETHGSKLNFRSTKYMTSLWLIWLMKPWIWLIMVENSLCGSKSLKIGLQIVWNMRKNISKICKKKLLLPEIMGDLVGPEMKNFSTGSRKIFFSKACKKLFRESYSRFLKSCHWTAVEAFEVWSAAMTSSPEIVRIKKFLWIFAFSGLLNSILLLINTRFTCLRFARQVFR